MTACATCKFFHKGSYVAPNPIGGEGTVTNGECRIRAPQIHPDSSRDGYGNVHTSPITIWPNIWDNNWCGEYQEKANPYAIP